MNRRGFLAALAGLPFVGKLFPKAEPDTPHILPMMEEAGRRITQKDKDEALCQMGIHEWRTSSEVYRRHLGFTEVDHMRCESCKVSVRMAPFHRTVRPGWWLEGSRDGSLTAVAGPVYPPED